MQPAKEVQIFLAASYPRSALLGAVVGAAGFFMFVPDPETSWFAGAGIGAIAGLFASLIAQRTEQASLDKSLKDAGLM